MTLSPPTHLLTCEQHHSITHTAMHITTPLANALDVTVVAELPISQAHYDSADVLQPREAHHDLHILCLH